MGIIGQILSLFVGESTQSRQQKKIRKLQRELASTRFNSAAEIKRLEGQLASKRKAEEEEEEEPPANVSSTEYSYNRESDAHQRAVKLMRGLFKGENPHASPYRPINPLQFEYIVPTDPQESIQNRMMLGQSLLLGNTSLPFDTTTLSAWTDGSMKDGQLGYATYWYNHEAWNEYGQLPPLVNLRHPDDKYQIFDAEVFAVAMVVSNPRLPTKCIIHIGVDNLDCVESILASKFGQYRIKGSTLREDHLQAFVSFFTHRPEILLVFHWAHAHQTQGEFRSAASAILLRIFWRGRHERD